MSTVYVGKQVTVTITKTVSGDKGSFLAQEVTFDPKQHVEGIDTLGFDVIQTWAPGLKTYEGTLKEAYKVGADGNTLITRAQPFQASFEEYTVTLVWDGGTGSKITITLTGCIFPEPSVVSPKNQPAFVTTKFKARSAAIAIA